MGFIKDSVPRIRFDSIDEQLAENKQIFLSKLEELIALQKETNDKLDKLIAMQAKKGD